MESGGRRQSQTGEEAEKSLSLRGRRDLLVESESAHVPILLGVVHSGSRRKVEKESGTMSVAVHAEDLRLPEALRNLLLHLNMSHVGAVSYDEPADPSGVHWLDLTYRDKAGRTVTWQQGHGYGLYRDHQTAYGERPSAVYPGVEDAARWIEQVWL